MLSIQFYTRNRRLPGILYANSMHLFSFICFNHFSVFKLTMTKSNLDFRHTQKMQCLLTTKLCSCRCMVKGHYHSAGILSAAIKSKQNIRKLVSTIQFIFVHVNANVNTPFCFNFQFVPQSEKMIFLSYFLRNY